MQPCVSHDGPPHFWGSVRFVQFTAMQTWESWTLYFVYVRGARGVGRFLDLTRLRRVDSSDSSTAVFLLGFFGVFFDRFISSSRVSGEFLLLLCFIEISVVNTNSVDSVQTLCSAASDLDLHWLPSTLLGVSRLKWVNSMPRLQLHINIIKGPTFYNF